MSKSIKLIYWNNDIPNYGDLLSPYIIKKLTGCEIIQKNYFVGNKKSHLYYFIKTILSGDFKFRSRYLNTFEKPILGIGSILKYGNRNTKIWGSGFMRETERCKGGKIYAIRGYLSLDIVKKQILAGDKIKLSKNLTIGDPALLMPIIYHPKVEKKYEIGIIPHFSEYEDLKKEFGDRYFIINLKDYDVEKVTSQILSCKKILSTSLHGLIIPHAYGIPALWMVYSGLEDGTNGFKFKDYFSSIGIASPKFIKFSKDLFHEKDSVENYFRTTTSLPKINIKNIQLGLLENAPFLIK